ncbi:MAG: hypothetical protein WCI67_02810 [Chloroflexales bacterium]
MRFQTHAIISALAGAVLYPYSPQRAATVLLSGTLLDIDHLVLYVLQTGDWSVSGALAYNRYRHEIGIIGDTRPRYDSLRSWLHNPLLLLPPLWDAAARRPALRPVAIGLTLHLLLDYLWWPRYTLAFWRAGRCCERCGRSDRRLTVHWSRAWGDSKMHILCRPCFAISAREIANR